MDTRAAESVGHKWRSRPSPSSPNSSASCLLTRGLLRCEGSGMPLSDAVSVSAGTGGVSCASPEKGVVTREPPKMGEGGNWQCHSCLNINYPRRTLCNRCLTERSKENSQKVIEFIRLKEGFLLMGLDQQTAAAAASAQQAARASTSNNSCTLLMSNRTRMVNSRITGSISTMGDSKDRMNSNGSTSRSLLELEADGLRLLSCPL